MTSRASQCSSSFCLILPCVLPCEQLLHRRSQSIYLIYFHSQKYLAQCLHRRNISIFSPLRTYPSETLQVKIETRDTAAVAFLGFAKGIFVHCFVTEIARSFLNKKCWE